MKRLFVFAVIILLAFNFNGCLKDVSETHHDFVGYWHGFNTYLYIMDDGYSSYFYYDGKHDHRAKGKAIVKKDYLHIGRLKKLKINQYPARDSFGQWTMILNNLDYYKQ